MARKIQFSGIVDAYGGGSWSATDASIGGTSVIEGLERTFGIRSDINVNVWLGIESVASGVLYAHNGFGGTDVTPPESPVIEIGDIDLINRLADLDGREVVLIVEET
jgi:hypothetical protein